MQILSFHMCYYQSIQSMQRATLLELSISLISQLNIKHRTQMTGKPTLINWPIQKSRTSRHY